MAKQSSGLQKNVSSIFDGVTMPADINHAAGPEKRECTASSESTRMLPPKPATRNAAKPFTKNKTKATFRKNYDNRQKKMTALVGVLFLVFVGMMTRAFWPLTKDPQDCGAASENTSEASTDTGKIVVVDWVAPGVMHQLQRDPMVATPVADPVNPASSTQQETTEPEGSALVVKGIVYSQERSSAVIGTRMVHQGDKVKGITVVKINKKDVVFEYNGKQWQQGVER